MSDLILRLFLALQVACCTALSVTGGRPKHELKSTRNAPTSSHYSHEHCAPLQNVAGTHFTAKVDVGKPAQSFDLVADTGSSNLIVASCECYNRGYCENGNKCFMSNGSSTLQITQGANGPATIVLTFGSGPIESVLASDTVSLGELNCSLPNGVLLMVDQMMTFDSPFEGILGLGFPESIKPTTVKRLLGPGDEQADEQQDEQHDNNTVPRVTGTRSTMAQDYIWTPHIFNETDALDTRFEHKDLTMNPSFCTRPNSRNKKFCDDHPELSHDITFLKGAGVERFSMCFNEQTGGALRLNTPNAKTSYDIISDYHWALGLTGITAGSATEPASVCSGEGMLAGQRSPCAAIIDSGTTYILGPGEQIQRLYANVCDRWPRCAQNFSAMENATIAARAAMQGVDNAAPWLLNPVDKAMVFLALLSDCDTWFDTKVGLTEIPSLSFHLAGSDSKASIDLELNAWSFVVSQEEDEMRFVYKDVGGFDTIVNYAKTGRKTWQCKPAFGALKYFTAKNGPAWILGLPLFYEYVVDFDMGKARPTVSFSKQPCDPCSPDENTEWKLHKAISRPRRIHGTPRIPDTISDSKLF